MSGLMDSFRELFGGPNETEDDHETDTDLDATLAALKAHARRLTEPNPYKVGDLVTVLDMADIKGRGEPHVVVEVFAEPVVDANAEAGSNQFMRPFNMRVAHMVAGSLTVHAVDHAVLERWTAEHADSWRRKRQAASGGKAGKVSPQMPLTDIVRLLRGEKDRLANTKITWKKGDLVEILGHQMSNAAEPMLFDGRAVGLVEVVDTSDDTTRVFYFDSDGDRRTQWFKPGDLKPYSILEAVRED